MFKVDIDIILLLLFVALEESTFCYILLIYVLTKYMSSVSLPSKYEFYIQYFHVHIFFTIVIITLIYIIGLRVDNIIKSRYNEFNIFSTFF